MPQVFIQNAPAYTLEDVQPVIEELFSKLEVIIPQNANVLLKPNLIMRCSPERGATTHPVIIEALIIRLKEMGVSRITIADSPGGLYTAKLLQANYEQTGMADVAQRHGVRLNTDCGFQTVRFEEGRICKTFELIAPVLQADYIINVCKLKTHAMTTLSCAVKNLFGCIPGLKKPELHYRFPEGELFAQMLVDLSRLVKPQLNIVDAVDAMQGDGPTAGTVRHLGVIAGAAGESVYALDLAMAHLTNLPQTQVPTIARSVERGLCPKRVTDVGIVGNPAALQPVMDFEKPATKTLDFTQHIGFVPGALVRKMRPLLEPKPKIRAKDCIGCGRCAQSCPAHVIELKDKVAHINLTHCIRCFCCHEMCPVKAIDVKTSPLFRLLGKRNTKQQDV